MKVFILYTADYDGFSICKVVDSLEKALNWKKQVQPLLDKYYDIWDVRNREENRFIENNKNNTTITPSLMKMWYESATYKAFEKELNMIEEMLSQYDTNAYNDKCGYYEYPVE